MDTITQYLATFETFVIVDAGGNFQYILGSRRKSKLKFV